MRKALVALLLLAAGCASRGGPDAESATDANAAASIRGLPAPLLPLGATSLPFQDLWLAGELSLDASLPPSTTTDETAFVGWVNSSLASFLDGRAASIKEIDRQLARVPAERIEERVMAEALLALVLEETARPVLAAEVPVTVTRPGREVTLRRALDESVGGLLTQAHAAYARCLRLTRGAPPHLHGWRRHCEEHAAALPPGPAAE